MAQTPDRMDIRKTLDVKGLNCPLPIFRTKMALSDLEAGEVIHILATDPHSVVDFQAFCARTGHELLHVVAGPKVFEFFLRHRRNETAADSEI